MRISVEFRGLTETQLEAILEMRENNQIVCHMNGNWLEEVGSGYYIPTATYDIGWIQSSEDTAEGPTQ